MSLQSILVSVTGWNLHREIINELQPGLEWGYTWKKFFSWGLPFGFKEPLTSPSSSAEVNCPKNQEASGKVRPCQSPSRSSKSVGSRHVCCQIWYRSSKVSSASFEMKMRLHKVCKSGRAHTGNWEVERCIIMIWKMSFHKTTTLIRVS